jgi:hypothetical protein
MLAYVDLGGTVNLTRFNTFAAYQNASGLFPTAAGANLEYANFTENEVWFYGGESTPFTVDCHSLPVLNEDALEISERFGSGGGDSGCQGSPRFGWAGDAFMHKSAVSPACPSSGTCYYARFKTRVRADGWILVYHLRSLVPYRAGLLRWTRGGRGNTTGLVDDTLLGVIINRTLEVIKLAAANSTTLPLYSRSLPTYYDFEFTDATLMLVGGRGISAGGYTPGSLGFKFNRGTYSIKHVSASVRARGSNTFYYLDGTSNRTHCISSGLGPSSDTGIAVTTAFTRLVNESGAVDSLCTGPTLSPPGNPFFAAPINTSVFNIPASTWVNVTHGGTELKYALMLLLG